MLVTGGHAYDTIQFFQMFDSMKSIDYVHFNQPMANQVLTGGEVEKFDVIVFYDMWKTISAPEKMAYLELTRQGKPLLFLHHSLASYQDWPEFIQIIGGKYFENTPGTAKEKISTYQHDVWVDVEVLPDMKVTRGLKSFRIFDEVYGNFLISGNVKPLLTTHHPQSTGTIGWENKFNNSTVIYLQPGHDKNAYENKNYRKLVEKSIIYLQKTK